MSGADPHALTLIADPTAALGERGWAIESSQGSASMIHNRAFEPGTPPTLLVHVCDRSAVVLGSSQPEAHIDHDVADELGLDVCRRRSGGGLVVIEPASSLWVDIVLPPAHPLWVDDVTASFDWIGQLWGSTLTDIGLNGVHVHNGRLVNADHGRFVCFAGLGPGEVVVNGHKVVGLSQRRGRFGARFQCLVLRDWPGHLTHRLFRPGVLPPDLDVVNLPAGLSPTMGPDLDNQAILDRFITGLAGVELS